MKSSFSKLLSYPFQISFKVGIRPFRIISKKRIRWNSSGSKNNFADSLHGQKRFRIFGHKSSTASLEQISPNLIFYSCKIFHFRFQVLSSENFTKNGLYTFLIIFRGFINLQPQCFRQMAFTEHTFCQCIFYPFNIQNKTCIDLQ
ncbi:hypothetical protein SDC9_180116 [bioreactor metagenome]|uniref:Uncharacterized protein n=1 Tax=bioreactor metagenome TaxID=1076179 RepID=A0A645H2D2_9ZZZZ